MKGAGFLNAKLVLVCCAALLIGCASEGNPTEGTSSDGARDAQNNTEGVEVAAVAVDDPCTCFEKGLSRGQLRYCRESKRDVSFLEALRKCGSSEVQGVSAIDKLPGDGQYTMNPKTSIVQWKGKKLGMTEFGTIPIRSCTVSIQNEELVSGNVVVEMNGLKSTSQQGLEARNLAEHLRSADFFDVANHPTAGFIFESGKSDGRGGLEFKGKLNIKGISNPVSGNLRFSSSDPVVTTVSMVFNRADFDVRYGSGTFFDNLGDDLISDEVILQIAMVEDFEMRKAN
mgnify:FL=1